MSHALDNNAIGKIGEKKPEKKEKWDFFIDQRIGEKSYHEWSNFLSKILDRMVRL